MNITTYIAAFGWLGVLLCWRQAWKLAGRTSEVEHDGRQQEVPARVPKIEPTHEWAAAMSVRQCTSTYLVCRPSVTSTG